MKIFIKLFIPLFVFMLLMSCLEGEKKQSVKINTPAEVKDEKAVVPDQFDQEFLDGMTGTLWHYYSEMRQALILSDPSQTRTVAEYLSESFEEKYGQLKSIALEISETDDLEQQRKLFHDLSRGLEPIFSKGLSAGAIYKQYCPMAFNNTGAFWLSNVAKIQNPYFGEKMKECGQVQKVIRKEE